MKVSHKETICESPAIEKLCRYLDDRTTDWQAEAGIPDLETFEKEVHERVMEIERELVAQELERYDVPEAEVEVAGVIYK